MDTDDSRRDGVRVEHMIVVGEGQQLWAREHGDRGAPALLLVMGANASGIAWPEALVTRLAAHHRVVVYDHRDTGRSSWAFDEHPYGLVDLAADAVAVLDALRIDRAHVVGMSMGGFLVQLLLLDHPDRLRSATVFATSALGAVGDPELPGPAARVLALWERMGDERTPAEETAWRIEHWRALHGDVLPFDAGEFRALEERVVAHSGTTRSSTAHARADQGGLERGAELAGVTVPTLVVEAPEDPINPPPHGEHLDAVINGSRRVRIPGMGHSLPAVVVAPLADAILAHTRAVDVP